MKEKALLTLGLMAAGCEAPDFFENGHDSNHQSDDSFVDGSEQRGTDSSGVRKDYCLDHDGDGAIDMNFCGSFVEGAQPEDYVRSYKEEVLAQIQAAKEDPFNNQSLLEQWNEAQKNGQSFEEFESSLMKPADCDDNEASVHPGAVDEPVNQIDEDCDGEDASDLVTYVEDFDHDGFSSADASSIQLVCNYGTKPGIVDDYKCDPAYAPFGYVLEENLLGEGEDCDDSNALVNPLAEERLVNERVDGEDSNCDGAEDCFLDGDEDGFGVDALAMAPGVLGDLTCVEPGFAATAQDCNDLDANINPQAPEIWYDGVDNDCRFGIDEQKCHLTTLMGVQDPSLPDGYRAELNVKSFNGSGAPFYWGSIANPGGMQSIAPAGAWSSLNPQLGPNNSPELTTLGSTPLILDLSMDYVPSRMDFKVPVWDSNGSFITYLSQNEFMVSDPASSVDALGCNNNRTYAMSCRPYGDGVICDFSLSGYIH